MPQIAKKLTPDADITNACFNKRAAQSVSRIILLKRIAFLHLPNEPRNRLRHGFTDNQRARLGKAGYVFLIAKPRIE